LAPLTDATDAYEFPLSQGMSALLGLEELAACLTRARESADIHWTHLVATRLGARLSALGPEGLDQTLLPEAQQWIAFLDAVAERPAADGGKVARMRGALQRLTDRLATDWPDYFRCLERDPWLAPYSDAGNTEGLRPSPRLWAALERTDLESRLESWEQRLEPLATLAEAVLRLTRDSLQWQELTIPPQGVPVALPAEPATGLVQVQTADNRHVPGISGLTTVPTLRLLTTPEMAAPDGDIPLQVGWFTL